MGDRSGLHAGSVGTLHTIDSEDETQERVKSDSVLLARKHRVSGMLLWDKPCTSDWSLAAGELNKATSSRENLIGTFLLVAEIIHP